MTDAPDPARHQQQIEWVTLDRLKVWPANPRVGVEEAAEKLAKLIAGHGFVNPIIATPDGTIRAGHTRLAAAKKLGMEKVPVIFCDLDEPELYAISDNKSGEFSEWDFPALKDILIDLDVGDLDMTYSGFDLPELERLVPSVPNPDADEVPEVQEKAISKTGDLWILGEHRLLCGDSTKPEDVARLFGITDKAQLLCTDPPYGVDFVKAKDGIPGSGFSDHSARWENIASDDLKDEKLQEFLEAAFKAALPYLYEDAAWYLWHAHLTQGFFAAAAAADVLLHRQIIWKKPGFVLTRSGMYHWAHEPAFFGWRKGHPPPWYGEKNQTSVWELGRDGTKEHPTQKPVELFCIPMRNHTKAGGICYEPFAGSGSQIMAAEQLSRRCYAIEISGNYTDLCLRRWEKLTEGHATLDGDGRTFAEVERERVNGSRQPSCNRI